MGRPFLEKFADVQWEVDEEHLQAWKEGRTGYPIVDAAMRACSKRGRSICLVQCGLSRADGAGWMENRLRMVTASFLVKSLMLDWRLGEKFFMESFIDGDLAANNGVWQWTASVSPASGWAAESGRGCLLIRSADWDRPTAVLRESPRISIVPSSVQAQDRC